MPTNSPFELAFSTIPSVNDMAEQHVRVPTIRVLGVCVFLFLCACSPCASDCCERLWEEQDGDWDVYAGMSCVYLCVCIEEDYNLDLIADVIKIELEFPVQETERVSHVQGICQRFPSLSPSLSLSPLSRSLARALSLTHTHAHTRNMEHGTCN
jgi:hypothetical protein